MLVRCSNLRELSGLAGIGLTHLTLTFLDQVDVGSLETLSSLHDLSVRLRRLKDLQPLPARMPLQRLAFGGRLPEASLAGIERFTTLEQVELIGVPSPRDIERLAALPQLTRLTIDSPAARDDSDWGQALRSVRPGLVITSAVSPGSSQVA